MSSGRNWTHWFKMWGNKAPAKRASDDFADYGTAFGLDMSLAAQADNDALPVPSTFGKNKGTPPSPLSAGA